MDRNAESVDDSQGAPGSTAASVGEEEAWLLSIIRNSGGISLSDLSRATGWSRTALQARIRELIGLQLVNEGALGTSSGGRRPRLLLYRGGAGTIIAVQLGQRLLTVSTTDLDGAILQRLTERVDVRDGPATVLPVMRELIERVFGETGVDRSHVIGVGIGIPGSVDFENGRPFFPPVMPGWHDYPLRDFFETTFGWPTFIDNDTNLMALGEQWFGLGRLVDNFVFVCVTPGIRSATVCDGRIYRGSDNCAGEIGHIPVGSENVTCQCGRTGCLEALAGANALAEAATQAALDGRSEALALLRSARGFLTEADLATAIEHGDGVALKLISSAGKILGDVLGYLVNFYNPRLIVIGGGVDALVELLLPSVRETIYRVSLPSATSEIAIRRSSLGDEACLLGAAALVLQERLGLAPSNVMATTEALPRFHRGRVRGSIESQGPEARTALRRPVRMPARQVRTR